MIVKITVVLVLIVSDKDATDRFIYSQTSIKKRPKILGRFLVMRQKHF